MFSSAKQAIKQALNGVGIEVRRFHPETSPLARLTTALRAFDIDIVLDIGANDGQFGKELRAGGYLGRMVSFEPLTTAHLCLSRESAGDPNWHVHPRCAVGDRLDRINLNVAGNSVSSSILPMLASHSLAAPESAYLGHESADLITLDSVAAQYFGAAHAPFLKIDTQGYEWNVLDGALATLPTVRGIQMELSLVPLYEGQRLWCECIERLQAEGFVLWALEPAFVDPATARTLQFDGLFFRQ